MDPYVHAIISEYRHSELMAEAAQARLARRARRRPAPRISSRIGAVRSAHRSIRKLSWLKTQRTTQYLRR